MRLMRPWAVRADEPMVLMESTKVPYSPDPKVFSQISASGGPFLACKNGAGHFWPGKDGAGQKQKRKQIHFLTSQVRCADMPAARQTNKLFTFFCKKLKMCLFVKNVKK